LTSHPLARAIAVPTGRDAAPSSGNVRHPPQLSSHAAPIDA
jgi:hypothetical protein